MPAPPRGKLYIDGVWDVSAGPQRPTEANLYVNGQDTAGSPVTAGTFDTYHPSTKEKIEWWFDRNVDKIPVVNFFYSLHEQAQTAKKETMIELAEKGNTKEAAVVGAAYGILVNAFIDAPGTIYETAKSIWDATPSTDMGVLGLRHETKSESEKIIAGDPDEGIKNELIMARAAPKTYSAEQKLKQAQELQPEIIKLNEQAEQLREQAKWFEENRKKAENDPFYARLYNAEAIGYNRQVIEYNQKVREIEAQLKALGVDEANKQVEEFNENLKKVNKNFAIGELAGSIVASAVLAEAVAPTIRAVAPEKVVTAETSFTDIFGDTAGTRTTVKETVYKGWLRKKPVETRYSTTLEVDGDIRYMKSFINGHEGVALRIGGKDTRQFVLNKFMSTEPLKAEPGPTPSAPIGPDEFEKMTGKPWPTGVIKKELETQTILKTTGGQELSIIELENKNIVVGKTTFDKKPFSPEFSLSAKETVLSPEDFALLQKITKVRSVRVGDKYLKASRSGNVVQTFYDPPTTEALETTASKITPETGMIKVNTQLDNAGGATKMAFVPPVSAERGVVFSLTEPETVAGAHIVQNTRQKIRAETSTSSQTFFWTQDMDIVKVKRELSLKFRNVQQEETTQKTTVMPRPRPDPGPGPRPPEEPPKVVPMQALKIKPTSSMISPREQDATPVAVVEATTLTTLMTTSTISMPSFSKPRVASPAKIRLPAGGVLFSLPKSFGRDSWRRKLAFWENPFGGGKRVKKKRRQKKPKNPSKRKVHKRGGGKRAKKR